MGYSSPPFSLFLPVLLTPRFTPVFPTCLPPHTPRGFFPMDLTSVIYLSVAPNLHVLLYTPVSLLITDQFMPDMPQNWFSPHTTWLVAPPQFPTFFLHFHLKGRRAKLKCKVPFRSVRRFFASLSLLVVSKWPTISQLTFAPSVPTVIKGFPPPCVENQSSLFTFFFLCPFPPPPPKFATKNVPQPHNPFLFSSFFFFWGAFFSFRFMALPQGS